MKVLFILPCSGRKAIGGHEHRIVDNDITHGLSLLSSNVLIESRADLFMQYNNNLEDKYLPAYERYTGKIYAKIDNQYWNLLIHNNKVSVIIISALYGVLSFNECIPYYNYKMTDNCMIDRINKVHNFWHNRDLSSVVYDFVETNRIETVYNCLSINYCKAIPTKTWNVEIILPPKFSDRGDRLGNWVNNKLGEYL